MTEFSKNPGFKTILWLVLASVVFMPFVYADALEPQKPVLKCPDFGITESFIFFWGKGDYRQASMQFSYTPDFKKNTFFSVKIADENFFEATEKFQTLKNFGKKSKDAKVFARLKALQNGKTSYSNVCKFSIGASAEAQSDTQKALNSVNDERAVIQDQNESESGIDAVENLLPSVYSCSEAGGTPCNAPKQADGTITPLESKSQKAIASTSGTTISVPANQRWFSSGIAITSGKQFSISATGTWSGNGSTYIGPNGYSSPAPDIYLAPGLNVGSLVGKIGDNKSFFIGSNFSGTASATGTLYLSFNDEINGFGDNAGSLSTTITTGSQPIACYSNADCGTNDWINSPYCSGDNVYQSYRNYYCNNPGTTSSNCSSSTTDKLKQSCQNGCTNGTCNSSGDTTTISVPANQKWYSSGISVNSGKQISITATGNWSGNNGGSYVGPNGVNGSAPASFVAPGLNPGSLVAKIASNSPFFVGSNYSGSANSTGTLYFSFNDDKTGFGDNTGTLTVTINSSSQTIACYSNSDCGTDGYTGSPYCQGGNVYQDYKTFSCNNPGSTSANCASSTTPKKKQECSNGCSNGSCSDTLTVTVTSYSDYIENAYLGNFQWDVSGGYTETGLYVAYKSSKSDKVKVPVPLNRFHKYMAILAPKYKQYSTLYVRAYAKKPSGSTKYSDWQTIYLQPFCFSSAAAAKTAKPALGASISAENDPQTCSETLIPFEIVDLDLVDLGWEGVKFFTIGSCLDNGLLDIWCAFDITTTAGTVLAVVSPVDGPIGDSIMIGAKLSILTKSSKVLKAIGTIEKLSSSVKKIQVTIKGTIYRKAGSRIARASDLGILKLNFASGEIRTAYENLAEYVVKHGDGTIAALKNKSFLNLELDRYIAQGVNISKLKSFATSSKWVDEADEALTLTRGLEKAKGTNAVKQALDNGYEIEKVLSNGKKPDLYLKSIAGKEVSMEAKGAIVVADSTKIKTLLAESAIQLELAIGEKIPVLNLRKGTLLSDSEITEIVRGWLKNDAYGQGQKMTSVVVQIITDTSTGAYRLLHITR